MENKNQINFTLRNAETLKAKPLKKSLVRAAIYATSLNQEGNCVSQLEDCRNFINQKGWTGFDIYFERISELERLRRPIFRLLLERAKSGCFDVVVMSSVNVLNLDASCAKVRRFLSEYNVSFCQIINGDR